ncbi:MAG: energy transducer TonB [Burkholderiales bacterium]|nr:energy transducer TonB [Burkholderiales bacterium]
MRGRLLTLPRAFAIAVALEALTFVVLEVNWASMFPPPEPEPVQAKLEYFEPPPPPPPPAPPPPPKQKPVPPKPPEPPKPEDKPLPAEKPLEPEPPPPPPPPPPPQETPPPPPDKPPPEERAKAVKKVMPVYPKDALAQGLEGKVRIRATVSALGKVLKTEVIESTPPGVFDYSAQTAVKKFVFPPSDDGRDDYEVDQVVTYRIEDDRYGPEGARSGK